MESQNILYLEAAFFFFFFFFSAFSLTIKTIVGTPPRHVIVERLVGA